MSKRITIEVFQTGTHTDSAGNTNTWTLEHLQQMATLYNKQRDHDAPVVLGHPKDDAPAYGWVESLKVEGTKLVATLKDLADEFVEWVKAGRYRKRSIALYADGLLRHVGFLGAMPPAVKGLADPQFAAGAFAAGAFAEYEFAEYEFGDYRVADVAGILRRIREHYIATGMSIDDADKIIPQGTLDWLAQTAPDYAADQLTAVQARLDTLESLVEVIVLKTPNFSEIDMVDDKNRPGDPPAQDPAKGAEYAEKIVSLETENAALKGQVGTLQTQVAELQRQNQEASFREFLDQPEMKKRVPPADREMALAELRAAARAGELEFSDGTKKPALEAKKEQMLKWPPVIEFGERATKERAANAGGDAGGDTGFRLAEGDAFDPERREQLIKAKKLAAEKKIEFGEALTIVMAEQPAN